MKQGILHPRLAPITSIIDSLKEANLQLPEGLYFPFRINANKWFEIEKIITLNAYYNDGKIFTILEFPLIAHTEYNILNVIALPIPKNGNQFAIIEIKNPVIAINTEKRSYMKLSQDNLHRCKKIDRKYLCEENFPIERIGTNSICEIEIRGVFKKYREF